jgi:hypothetical protein
MHTCYSLCTNEVFNLGFSNHNLLTRLLHSLALKRCFSAEQISKRAQMDEWEKYLYTPHTNPTFMCQLSIFRIDRTRRLLWPDASGQWLTAISSSNFWVWSDEPQSLICTDWTRLVADFPLWTLSILDRTRPQWRPVKDPSSPDCRPRHLRVRSSKPQRSIVMVLLLLSTALTGRVRSRQRPRPVKQTWLKLLWITTQLEPSFF